MRRGWEMRGRVVQIPMRVLRQCLRFALYLSFGVSLGRSLWGCSKAQDVPDGVTSSQSDPLRNRSVLLLGSGELLLRTEGLVALY
jgi:hypothetical protein